ncbi:hypothetical protein O6H91_11G033000 [Diphasiastrum complanatum]|uniref:Uncharacterized protein n=1 Tax=Diphasiastrum complanatum TaxID=34168 RepID=A0ACC2C866_DIPCM|nr:hypothetical protein O6H91_11G033000 [Diphasiastrum complanatum]
MGSLWAAFCWRLIHACLDVVYFFSAIRLRLLALCWAFPFFVQGEEACIQQILGERKRLPKTVAIVLDSEEARHGKDKVVVLLWWLKKVGVCHVSLYDMEGLMKTSQHVLEDNYSLSTNKAERVHFYHHKGRSKELIETDDKGLSKTNMSNLFCVTDKTGEAPDKHIMLVELLSLEDGKEAIVRAARHLCTSAQKMRVESLSEADLNESMIESGVGGPDPDLLIIFGAASCLFEFPPWRIRLTEILYFGSLKNLTAPSFVSLLNDFSKKTHRYGK